LKIRQLLVTSLPVIFLPGDLGQVSLLPRSERRVQKLHWYPTGPGVYRRGPRS
jgi:hypothetical protein